MKKLFTSCVIASSLACTSALTCTTLTKNITKGSKVSEVRSLQDFLMEKGYLKAVPNGYFGVGTYAGVKAYQKDVGLDSSGSVLAKTRASIQKDSCKEGEVKKVATSTPAVVAPATSSSVKEGVVEDKSASLIVPKSKTAPSPLNTYSDTVFYDTPSGSPETIHVSLALKNGLISDVGVTYDAPVSQTSLRFLKSFTSALDKSSLSGKKISDVSLSRVGGASLTTNAFMKALAHIDGKL
jgi:hypothetical protein